MTQKTFLATLAIGAALMTSAQAQTCSPTFVNSIVARMNIINATSGACRQALASNSPQICNVCRPTYLKLTNLRATYKANKGCFRSSPRIMGKVTALWSYRSDIKRLRKLCG
jgi:hypothetical protein